MDDAVSLHMSGLQIHSQSVRELLAEFLGTLVLTCLGCSGNAHFFLNTDSTAGIVTVPWIWGFALTAAIYVCGGVSGGHVNPAVSLGMASVGKLSWGKLPHYILGQFLGALAGASIVYAVYNEAITEKVASDPSMAFNMTVGIFVPTPGDGVSNMTQLIDQIICCAFFLLIINAITDEHNMSCQKGLVPLVIGISDLTLMVYAFGYNSGAPLNPARDLSPRLLTWLIGWGPNVFSTQDMGHYWIPLVGCTIGGVLGSWVYRLFIENHWPDESYEVSTIAGKFSANVDNYFLNGKATNRVQPI